MAFYALWSNVRELFAFGSTSCGPEGLTVEFARLGERRGMKLSGRVQIVRLAVLVHSREIKVGEFELGI